MSDTATIVLVVGAVVTVLWLVALVTVTVQRAGRAIEDATATTARLTAASAQLTAHQEVTQRELDRLGDRLDRLRGSRTGRRAGW
ncbi:MAG: hypothetical protein ACLFS9_02570 [Nitriliruptoraceae bacterium]